MKTRRHHNNTGQRQIKQGRTAEQVKHMARRLGVAPAGHPYDVCKCGDYRRDHKDGGACMWNNTDLGHANGRPACTKFRFASRATISADDPSY